MGVFEALSFPVFFFVFIWSDFGDEEEVVFELGIKILSLSGVVLVAVIGAVFVVGVDWDDGRVVGTIGAG